MERDDFGRCKNITTANFNSHAHVERDFSAVTEECVRQGISTHTLTWSVTNPPTLETKGYKNFNSHAHVERDLTMFNDVVKIANFNSHAHVERDLIAVVGMVAVEVFQLTRSRGA